MAESKNNVETKTVVNDLIFKELVKRGYSLEGNTRVWNIADSKLWYLTSDQAQAYLDVEKSDKYKKDMIDPEIELLEEAIPKIKNSIVFGNEVTIVDIGCGDGKKAIVPIQILKESHNKIKYCPVDISAYMVERAIEKISKENSVDEIIDFQWNVSDFENMENVTKLLRRGGKELFMMFLGSTLGNFDPHDVLYALQNSMEFGDSLLIGVALSENIDPVEIERAYASKYSDHFLGYVLTELGFDREDIEFGARYRHSRVESYFKINKEKIIIFQDKEIRFNKGDQIIVAYSHKFDKKKLEGIVKLYFANYTFFINKEKTWALILCKK